MKQFFTNITEEELTKLIEKAVDSSLISTVTNQSVPEPDLIKVTEVMEMLQVSRTTIHKYVKEGVLKSYHLGKGGGVFYSRKEIIEAIKNSGKHD